MNDGTWTYTWQNGRQLKKMQKSGETVEFVYNENGLRVQKTATSTGVTKYTLHGKNIVHMTQGSNELHFFYDTQNKPAVVVFNGTPYSYVKNLQGDIIAILDSNGIAVVQYRYDAWGRQISCDVAAGNSNAAALSTLNPFRYRGYVYDEETGLYYLRRRYHNVMWLRFMNADILLTRNVYQYCNNNPCRYADPSGLETEAAGLLPDTIVIDVDAAILVLPTAEQYFNANYFPVIMSYLSNPADYCYPGKGGTGIAIDCSGLMLAITGKGSPMARFRYDRCPGKKGPLFKNGELAVELVVGMEVFKTSYRYKVVDGEEIKIPVENGHVGMLIMYDFPGDDEGEVWAVFQSVSGAVSKSQALYPKGTDDGFGPNITRLYDKNGDCNWENYTDPWYYFDPLFTGESQ